MDQDIRNLLKIPSDRLDSINAVLLDPNEIVISDFLRVVEKFGTPEEINRRFAESRQLPNLIKRVKAANPDYIKDLEWLIKQRDKGAFIPIADYRRKILGSKSRWKHRLCSTSHGFAQCANVRSRMGLLFRVDSSLSGT
jgi:hypothetical protein